MSDKHCLHCDEAIEGDDYRVIPHVDASGTPSLRFWHRECLMRSVIGGINHQRGLCKCCGGNAPPDPPELSRREAALAACMYHRSGL